MSEEWEDLNVLDRGKMFDKVYDYFPNATLDNDGTFTSSIPDVFEVIEELERLRAHTKEG